MKWLLQEKHHWRATNAIGSVCTPSAASNVDSLNVLQKRSLVFCRVSLHLYESTNGTSNVDDLQKVDCHIQRGLPQNKSLECPGISLHSEKWHFQRKVLQQRSWECSRVGQYPPRAALPVWTNTHMLFYFLITLYIYNLHHESWQTVSETSICVSFTPVTIWSVTVFIQPTTDYDSTNGTGNICHKALFQTQATMLQTTLPTWNFQKKLECHSISLHAFKWYFPCLPEGLSAALKLALSLLTIPEKIIDVHRGLFAVCGWHLQ